MSSTIIDVRDGGIDRAAGIAALHAGNFEPPWDEAAVHGLLALSTVRALVAVDDPGAPACAFIIAQAAADEAEILSVAVTPGRQRERLATRLLEHLIGSFRDAGISRLFLEVAEDNSAARAFYARMGFREIGRRRLYYQRAGRPAVDALNLSRCI